MKFKSLKRINECSSNIVQELKVGAEGLLEHEVSIFDVFDESVYRVILDFPVIRWASKAVRETLLVLRLCRKIDDQKTVFFSFYSSSYKPKNGQPIITRHGHLTHSYVEHKNDTVEELSSLLDEDYFVEISSVNNMSFEPSEPSTSPTRCAL